MASPDPSTADVERLILRSLGALVLFVFATGVGFALARDEQVARNVAGDDGGAVLEKGTIGPLPGATLEAYERSARRALSEASGRRQAVVSFRRYVTEGDARASVPGATALLVAAPSGVPRMVTDVAVWAQEERAEALAEKGELEALIPTVEDPAFAAQYRRDIARLERLVDRIDPAGRIVFGAVIEDEVVELRALAKTAGVRLVDVAREDSGEVTSFRGLRPEETEVANDPPTRP